MTAQKQKKMPYHFVIKSFQKSLQVILITLKKYLIT